MIFFVSCKLAIVHQRFRVYLLQTFKCDNVVLTSYPAVLN